MLTSELWAAADPDLCSLLSVGAVRGRGGWMEEQPRVGLGPSGCLNPDDYFLWSLHAPSRGRECMMSHPLPASWRGTVFLLHIPVSLFDATGLEGFSFFLSYLYIYLSIYLSTYLLNLF